MISDLKAKQIAADYHGGQRTALYSLCSTGFIDRTNCLREISSCMYIADNTDLYTLATLTQYVVAKGNRDVQIHWSDLTW